MGWLINAFIWLWEHITIALIWAFEKITNYPIPTIIIITIVALAIIIIPKIKK